MYTNNPVANDSSVSDQCSREQRVTRAGSRSLGHPFGNSPIQVRIGRKGGWLRLSNHRIRSTWLVRIGTDHPLAIGQHGPFHNRSFSEFWSRLAALS
jgi:hypothetical protein